MLASVQRCCCIIGNYKRKLSLIKSRGELRTSPFMNVITSTTSARCYMEVNTVFSVLWFFVFATAVRVLEFASGLDVSVLAQHMQESNAHLESAKHTAQVCLWVWRSCKGCVSLLCAAKHLKCFYDHQRHLPDGGCDANRVTMETFVSHEHESVWIHSGFTETRFIYTWITFSAGSTSVFIKKFVFNSLCWLVQTLQSLCVLLFPCAFISWHQFKSIAPGSSSCLLMEISKLKTPQDCRESCDGQKSQHRCGWCGLLCNMMDFPTVFPIFQHPLVLSQTFLLRDFWEFIPASSFFSSEP